MAPIWAAVVAGMAVAFLAVDFWWDKRKTERREALDADMHAEELRDDYPRWDADVYRRETGEYETFARNVSENMDRGHDPAAYYAPNRDIYVLPLRGHEWQALDNALNTVAVRSIYHGDIEAIRRRMRDADL